jgi:hypothetical protein
VQFRPLGGNEPRAMNDELKKLGLRIRPRTVTPQPKRPNAPGEIAFDDRGNAVYSWKDDLLVQDSEDAEKARRRALDHPGLSMMEDEPHANAPIRNNHKGTRIGYNPYESGMLKKEYKKKTDLRELSKWLEQKRKAENKSED